MIDRPMVPLWFDILCEIRRKFVSLAFSKKLENEWNAFNAC